MENQDWKLGLREETIPVFEAVSQMEVVKVSTYVEERLNPCK